MNVNNALKKMDPVMEKVLSGISGSLSEGFDTGSVLEGKRYRAYLFFALSRRDDKESLMTASALEIVHAATLVHDDIIDGGILRRSRPALHMVKGVPAGILYGDLLFNAAFGLLAELSDPEIWKEFHKAVSLVVSGEVDQQLKRADVRMRESEYMDIIERKTGALFALACRLGGMAECRNSDEIGSLAGFGRTLGTVYQILDDCMDLLEHGRDKTNRRDIQNGVMTLPLIAAFEKDREGLRELFAELPMPEERVAVVVHKAIVSGGLKKAVKRASDLMEEAVTGLPEGYMSPGGPVRGMVRKLMKKVEYVKKEDTDLRRRFCGDQRLEQAGKT
ncbi:MAG: hypothetical protein GF392_02930 [Candidatus Omnitrophica bacterium]|nr:hypothetical protein [Candidatus Omnitrophota bacterium]